MGQVPEEKKLALRLNLRGQNQQDNSESEGICFSDAGRMGEISAQSLLDIAVENKANLPRPPGEHMSRCNTEGSRSQISAVHDSLQEGHQQAPQRERSRQGNEKTNQE